MNSRIFILFVALAVVFISGCTAGPSAGVAGGPGIVFESFEADFTNVFLEEPVTLTAEIINMATRDSGPVEINLVGIESNYVETGECVYNNGLLGADPVYGTQGESKICELVAKFPQGTVSQGLSTTFQPTARLFYTFQTETVKAITVAPQAELRAIQNRGGTLPIETATSTGGPIALDIKSSGPVRIFEDTSRIEIPIEISITNVGGGTPYGSFDQPDTWNKISLVVDSISGGINPDADCEREVSLHRGQSATVVCRINIDGSDAIGAVQKLLSIKADYGYFVDKSLTLTVSYRET